MRGVRICSNVKILLSLGVALDTLMSYANHEESEEVIFSSWIMSSVKHAQRRLALRLTILTIDGKEIIISALMVSCECCSRE